MWRWLSPEEPIYNGKTFTFWLQQRTDNLFYLLQYGKGSKPLFDEADHALRHIGTNGIPTLLTLAGSKESDLRIRLRSLLKRQSVVSIQFRTANADRYLAFRGFEFLGAGAGPAVPGLTSLLKSSDFRVQCDAAKSLGAIGPAANNAVPDLVAALNETNSDVRLFALSALQSIHSRMDVVVPALTDALPHSNEHLRFLILEVLTENPEYAKSSVRMIVPLLNDPDPMVRSEATNALVAIDPSAAK